jgi:hypothetical protein
MMYNLQYFRKSQNGICAADFDNKRMHDLINPSFLLSLSGLQNFHTITGNFAGKFSIVTMSNDDKYYIDEISFNALQEYLKGIRENG